MVMLIMHYRLGCLCGMAELLRLIDVSKGEYYIIG